MSCINSDWTNIWSKWKYLHMFSGQHVLCLRSTLNIKVLRERWGLHYRYRSSSLHTSFTFVSSMHCTEKMYMSFSETLQSIHVLCTTARKSIISASNCRPQKSPVQSISKTVNLHSTQYFKVNKTKQQQQNADITSSFATKFYTHIYITSTNTKE